MTSSEAEQKFKTDHYLKFWDPKNEMGFVLNFSMKPGTIYLNVYFDKNRFDNSDDISADMMKEIKIGSKKYKNLFKGIEEMEVID